MFDADTCGGTIKFCGNDSLTAAQGAQAVVIATEWDQFLDYDLREIRSVMNEEDPQLYDLRCYMNRDKMLSAFDRVF